MFRRKKDTAYFLREASKVRRMLDEASQLNNMYLGIWDEVDGLSGIGHPSTNRKAESNCRKYADRVLQRFEAAEKGLGKLGPPNPVTESVHTYRGQVEEAIFSSARADQALNFASVTLKSYEPASFWMRYFREIEKRFESKGTPLPEHIVERAKLVEQAVDKAAANKFIENLYQVYEERIDWF